jgi:hypothetical protein
VDEMLVRCAVAQEEMPIEDGLFALRKRPIFKTQQERRKMEAEEQKLAKVYRARTEKERAERKRSGQTRPRTTPEEIAAITDDGEQKQRQPKGERSNETRKRRRRGRSGNPRWMWRAGSEEVGDTKKEPEPRDTQRATGEEKETQPKDGRATAEQKEIRAEVAPGMGEFTEERRSPEIPTEDWVPQVIVAVAAPRNPMTCRPAKRGDVRRYQPRTGSPRAATTHGQPNWWFRYR